MVVPNVFSEHFEEINYPIQARFNPYDFNGGTIVAIAGKDFAVIASDNRLLTGFSILSRNVPKTIQMNSTSVLGSCGFHGDVLTLTKIIQMRLMIWRCSILQQFEKRFPDEMHLPSSPNIHRLGASILHALEYYHVHNKEMDTPSLAAMLSTILYYRRFFPYYVYNIIAGLDSEGKGCVFSFDPVGSYERGIYKAAGSASAMLQPLLDSQVGLKNQQGAQQVPLSKANAVALIKDVFISAAERDIHTGDAVTINIVCDSGVTTETFPLRRD